MSATKFLTLRHHAPYVTQQTFGHMLRVHQKTLTANANRAAMIRMGPTMIGDPSWLSQFIKHNSKIIGGITGAIGTVIGGPIGGLVGGAIGSSIGRGANPQTRPQSSAPLGTAAGLSSGLAPAGSFPLTLGNYPGTGGFAPSPSPIPDPYGGAGTDSTNPTDSSGNPPVVAIPSSGGGSMLYHHFFGTSHSKAIPVNQTNGIRPRGYHVNKHGYYLSSIATWLQPGTVYVPNRRRNPLNPRALHRSIARLVSARHAVKKLGIIETVRHRPVRRRMIGGIPRRKQLGSGR